MNWIFSDGEMKKESRKVSREKVAFKCLTCGRKVYAYPDGYLPIHRKKGERGRCNGSDASTHYHKKLS